MSRGASRCHGNNWLLGLSPFFADSHA